MRGLTQFNVCCSKYLLCFFNFSVFIFGGAILGTGIWLYVEKDSFFDFFRQDPNLFGEELNIPGFVQLFSYLLMVLGALVFFLSLLGYCGAVVESKCLIVFYGLLLIAILGLEITAGVLSITHREQVVTGVKTFLRETINEYDPDPRTTDRNSLMWNGLMKKMSCCGVDNSTDFKVSQKFLNERLEVPVFCCKLGDGFDDISPKDPDCQRNPKPESSYYQTGCYKVVKNHILSYMKYIVIGVIGVVLIEIVAIFFAFCLCSSLRSRDEEEEDYEK